MQYDQSMVGASIRRLRKQKNMTQEVLRGLAGIARTHLTMIENGTKQPNFETIWRFHRDSCLISDYDLSTHSKSP